jgi:hypothetical protein
MGEIKVQTRFWSEDLKERKKPLDRPRHRWKDNIKIIFEKYSVRWTDLPGSRQGSVAGCCAHSNESGPMKGKQFLD